MSPCRIVRFAAKAIHVHCQRPAIFGDDLSLAIIRQAIGPAERRGARNGREGTAFERPDQNLPDRVLADRLSVEDQRRGAIGLIADGLEGLESHFSGVALRPCLCSRQRGQRRQPAIRLQRRGTAISFCWVAELHYDLPPNPARLSVEGSEPRRWDAGRVLPMPT